MPAILLDGDGVERCAALAVLEHRDGDLPYGSDARGRGAIDGGVEVGITSLDLPGAEAGGALRTTTWLSRAAQTGIGHAKILPPGQFLNWSPA